VCAAVEERFPSETISDRYVSADADDPSLDNFRSAFFHNDSSSYLDTYEPVCYSNPGPSFLLSSEMGPVSSESPTFLSGTFPRLLKRIHPNLSRECDGLTRS